MDVDGRLLDALTLSLDHITAIRDRLRGVDQQAFAADGVLVDATAMRFIALAERVKFLPAHLRNRHPHIPWTSIVAMRNLIAHLYEDIDPGILWDTATNDLEPLDAALREMLRSLGGGQGDE
jgi:uncharacterized protein with HEPN domain